MSLASIEIGPEGALVEIAVEVFTARANALRRLGQPVPGPQWVKAQIDTGAYRTGLDRRIFEALGIGGEIDTEDIRTVSTGDCAHTADVYVCNLTVIAPDGGRMFSTLRVLAHDFSDDEEARGLIGRDILAQCRLTWNGPAMLAGLSF